jgi:tRNA pseudouridine13 synthase
MSWRTRSALSGEGTVGRKPTGPRLALSQPSCYCLSVLPSHDASSWARLPRGRIKTKPEDFVVEELPAYEPSGEGDHLFVRFTKRGLTTDEAASKIARATAVPVRDIGIAGMKDKIAVATQTVSLPIPAKKGHELEARVRELAIEGVTVLSARRHTNKLRTGHLAGNRFSIVIREIELGRVDEVVSTLEAVGRRGLPNAFGPQRFGREKDNAEKARAWLSGRAPAPRDGRLRRLLFSALQAELFNRVLDTRVAQGTWATPLPGDLVKRTKSHALFLWTGAADEDIAPEARASEGPPLPTGPMFGVKMRSPEGEPLAIEQRVYAEGLGDGVDLAGTRNLGEGTRRPLGLRLEGLEIERLAGTDGSGLTVGFVLPKGAYATSVLGTALALDDGTSAALPRRDQDLTDASLQTNDADSPTEPFEPL